MERITLYGSFTSSSSYKPMLYLALARLPFSFRTVNLKYGRQKEPEYLAINRWGVVPSLRHRGLTILQSNTILDYLARETGPFEGASEQEVIAEYRPKAEAALSFVDTTLKDRDWLVGNQCTIADIGCWGRMVFMAEGGFEIANWPSLEAWSRRLKAMPGFGLPYDLIPSKDREFDPE